MLGYKLYSRAKKSLIFRASNVHIKTNFNQPGTTLMRYCSRNILKLKDRGMFQDFFPNTNANEIVNKLNGAPQTVYAGFDPTAESLHVGHLLVLVNLLHWQRGGHNVICLLGGATGQIGDPSRRLTDRPFLSKDLVDKNVSGIINNIRTIFDNHQNYLYNGKRELPKYKLINNEEWYKQMNSIQFVSEVGRHFRMGTMLLKQNVQTKLNSEIGMSFTEFTYQIFQSYDWLHLFKNYNCCFQVGGSDQMGNIVAGYELIKRMADKPVYGLTLPLITSEEGDKFGKSAGNALWLHPELTSPFSLYQYFLRTKDSLVENYLKLLTFYHLGEIKDIMHKHEDHPEQRYPQNCLADQLVTLVHGEKGLQAAKNASKAIYSKDINSLVSLTQSDIVDIFKGAKIVDLLLEPGITVLNLAMRANCFPTQEDALRIIDAGGFYVNHERVKKVDEVITQSAHILPNLITLLRVGKRNYYIVKWQT